MSDNNAKDVTSLVIIMPNRLAKETSPYLQQHSNNPVEWYPWGEEALARAKTESNPFSSVLVTQHVTGVM